MGRGSRTFVEHTEAARFALDVCETKPLDAPSRDARTPTAQHIRRPSFTKRDPKRLPERVEHTEAARFALDVVKLSR